ncbi:hypothetical protein [Kribbella deserti]|uniref:Saccharopine dehydrogenase NADP binding domain-containing protein n=1 Tax=Kribbella deserti TaxID=1926257 RepID=A0ABV6QFL5_9ACTN
MIGILGGYGEVGRSAASILAGRQIRIGGRDASRGFAVDVTDEQSLDRFIAGCELIVNCTGPSHLLSATVAKAVLRAGVDLVDAGGDETLRTSLDDEARVAGRTVMLAAGALPGLSGIVPRWLAADLGGLDHLTAYFAVADRFTKAAAEDYLDGVLGMGNEPLAAWRDGGAVPEALHRRHDVMLPYLATPVSAFPFLDDESRQVARDLDLSSGAWYSVIEGERLLAALDRARGTSRAEAVEDVCRSAALDLAGRTGRTTFVVQGRGGSRTRTAVVRGPGISVLTGAVAGLAATAVLEGNVLPGAWSAATALDPVATIDRLRAVARCSVLPASIEDLTVVEEGVL